MNRQNGFMNEINLESHKLEREKLEYEGKQDNSAGN